MRTLRALSTLVVFAGIAAVGSAACASKSEKKGLDRGTGGGGGTGGTTMVAVTGGSAGSGGSGATGGSNLGGTDSGTAAAAGSNGIAECGELAGLGKCGGTHVEAEFRTVNMLLVIDKSGSMDDQPQGFSQKKWPAMRSAIATALGKVETQMNFGLVLYPYSETQIPLDGCEDIGNCCSLATNGAGVVVGVQPGVVSVDQINAALTQTGPGGGTPTAAALAAALEYFTNGQGAGLSGNNYVLLATDGGPNCNDDLLCTAERCTTNLDKQCDSGNCCDDELGHMRCLDDDSVTTELQALRDAGISTFVVGIPGTEAYSEYLDSFARTGGVPAVGADHDYYEVSAGSGVEGLTSVFESITTQLVRDCSIALPETPSKLDLVNVAIDCNVVPQNTDTGTSGWDFDQTPEPTSVIVHGQLCDAIQQNGAERVDVVFGCPTVR